jgi:hypothetical protein
MPKNLLISILLVIAITGIIVAVFITGTQRNHINENEPRVSSSPTELAKKERYPCLDLNEVLLLANRPSTNAFNPLVMVASNFFYETNINTTEKTTDRLTFFLEVWIYRGEPGSSQQKKMWIGETMDYKGYRITVVDLGEDEEFEADGGGFTIPGDYACVRVENLNTTPTPAE